MTNPLQQAIERSRTASDWCTTEERVFREAAAIMAEALERMAKQAPIGENPYEWDMSDLCTVDDGRDYGVTLAGYDAKKALAKANALFEEPNHD